MQAHTSTTLIGRIRAAIAAIPGLNQAKVEAEMGVSSGYISRIASGDIKELSAEKAIAMAQILRRSVEWLALGVEAMPKYPVTCEPLELALAEADAPDEVAVQLRALYAFDRLERTKEEWRIYAETQILAWQSADERRRLVQYEGGFRGASRTPTLLPRSRDPRERAPHQPMAKRQAGAK